MKTLSFVLFLISFSLSSSLFASLEKPESYKEITIYNRTLKLCKSDEFSLKGLTDLSAYKDVAKIVFNSSLETVTQFKLEVSSDIQEMLSEYWFYKALNECYGDNRLRKDFFVISLLTADRVGKIVTVLGGGFIARKVLIDTFGYIVYLVGKAKTAYVINVLRYSLDPKLAVAIFNSPANPKLYAAFYAFNTAAILDGVISGVRESFFNKKSNSELDQIIEQNIIDETLKLSEQPQNTETEKRYKELRDQMLQAQKKYLEEKLGEVQNSEERNKILNELQRINNLLKAQ